jgi:hypothetical protein
MDIFDTEEAIVKNEKKNIARTLKFLNSIEVNMTVLNSIVLLAIFLIVTVLILASKELLYILKL